MCSTGLRSNFQISGARYSVLGTGIHAHMYTLETNVGAGVNIVVVTEVEDGMSIGTVLVSFLGRPRGRLNTGDVVVFTWGPEFPGSFPRE